MKSRPSCSVTSFRLTATDKITSCARAAGAASSSAAKAMTSVFTNPSALPGSLAVLVDQRHGGLGREHAERHRLDHVEPHHLVGVALVADRQVAADRELEIARADTQHDRALDGGRPHERTVHELADDVEHRVTAVADGLGQAGVVAGSHGDRIGPVHAGQAKEPRRLRDAVRIGLVVVGNGQDGMRGGLVDALDAAGRVAVEDRGVLGEGDAGRGVEQRLELGVLRSALDRVHLLARELEVGAQLDERHGLPPRGLDVRRRRAAERLAAPGVDSGGGGTQGPVEVHELAAGELELEHAGGLGVDFVPRRGRDGGQLALEIVHIPCPPFRLPMPSEPPPPPAAPASPSAPAVPVCSMVTSEPLVKRYSFRCASIFASRRRYHSSSMAKCSFSSSRLCAKISFSPSSVAASTRWSYQSAASSSSCIEVSARWLSSVSGRSLLSDSWYPTEFAIVAPLRDGVARTPLPGTQGATGSLSPSKCG